MNTLVPKLCLCHRQCLRRSNHPGCTVELSGAQKNSADGASRGFGVRGRVRMVVAARENPTLARVAQTPLLRDWQFMRTILILMPSRPLHQSSQHGKFVLRGLNAM